MGSKVVLMGALLVLAVVLDNSSSVVAQLPSPSIKPNQETPDCNTRWACCDSSFCRESCPPKCSCADVKKACHAACRNCSCTKSIPPQCRCMDVDTYVYPSCKGLK